MGYTNAVTDWDANDYFDLAFWNKIYRNTQIVSELVSIVYTPVTWNNTPPFEITTIPNIAHFNTLLTNIEFIRLAVASVHITGTETEIKRDWEAGFNKEAFSYIHANIWEATLDAIWRHYNGGSYSACPSLSSDLNINSGSTIYVDCIDTNGHDITVNGGTLSII